jgi:3',5'-cyclic AMP phosphodiesterase CpdA
MRTIVHLSDLHFGRTDPTVVTALISIVSEIEPDLIAVSGDLTQRARSWQFQEARAFLDTLPKPHIIVPGNHDVPLYNVFSRFLSPLEKYQRHITADFEPFYVDEEMAVIGVNTARSLTFKGGRINELQVARVREKICDLGDNIVKVVVSHHPFDLPEGHPEKELVGRASMAMAMLASCGADLFLAGHLHVSHIGHTAERYRIEGHSAIVVQAGTATSTRSRGESNSFNVIRLQHPGISVERIQWQPERSVFALVSTEQFTHSSDGWVRA